MDGGLDSRVRRGLASERMEFTVIQWMIRQRGKILDYIEGGGLDLDWVVRLFGWVLSSVGLVLSLSCLSCLVLSCPVCGKRAGTLYSIYEPKASKDVSQIG